MPELSWLTELVELSTMFYVGLFKIVIWNALQIGALLIFLIFTLQDQKIHHPHFPSYGSLLHSDTPDSKSEPGVWYVPMYLTPIFLSEFN